LTYLAPSSFRVALSNRRLLKLENDQLTFRVPAKAGQPATVCTLPLLTFLHRFWQHVLPKGARKVRYFGFFSPAQGQRLAWVWAHFGRPPPARPAAAPTPPAPSACCILGGHPLQGVGRLPRPHCRSP